MLSGAGLTVKLTVPVLVVTGDVESVALTVRVEVPGAVGVPVIAQPDPSARPACRVPEVIVQV